MNWLLLQRLQQIIANSRATDVGVAARRLSDGEEVRIYADQSFHPASTIKVCIMMESYRQASAGNVSLDDSITVHNQFYSIVDGSSYALDVKDDSETELYNCIGQQFSRRELIRRMITVSSNLASNLLLEELDPQNVTGFMQVLGTDELKVLRGFEDKLAYRRGLNSSATARGFLHILTRLAQHAVVSPEASAEMIDILSQQQFNEMIPAGLPAGIRVAHKTGWAADYHHDVGIVYPPQAEPYVLCILTKGYEEEENPEAYALVASLSKVIYEKWSGEPSSV